MHIAICALVRTAGGRAGVVTGAGLGSGTGCVLGMGMCMADMYEPLPSTEHTCDLAALMNSGEKLRKWLLVVPGKLKLKDIVGAMAAPIVCKCLWAVENMLISQKRL
ncbi:hypothetical protein V8E53_009888 [Lactarius tabidus]